MGALIGVGPISLNFKAFLAMRTREERSLPTSLESVVEDHSFLARRTRPVRNDFGQVRFDHELEIQPVHMQRRCAQWLIAWEWRELDGNEVRLNLEDAKE